MSLANHLTAKEIPSIPEYTINRLDFRDVPIDGNGKRGVAANVSITLHNDYPVALTIPSIGFEVLMPDCDSEPYIEVASVITNPLDISPNANVTAEAQGLIREIPDSLTRACPLTKLSPLDKFMDHYLHGEDAQVFVRGKKMDETDIPDWASSILEGITVPVAFPGQSFGDFIRNLSLTDVDFKLPSPFADPNAPDSQPRVSGTVEVLAALPAELNVDLEVDGLQAKGDVLYQGKKFGELELDHWQKANSTRITVPGEDQDLLSITSRVDDAPLNITDGDVFSDLMQVLLFGDDDIVLDVTSKVDVRVVTVLGRLIVKGVPAKGKIPVKRSSLFWQS